MSNIWVSYVTVTLAGLFGFMATLDNVASPEEQILGQWEESHWEYEKVDKTENDSANLKHISDDVKDMIGQNLIIHKAETWIFLPGRKVRLLGKDTDRIVDWRISGRGHILQFKHENHTIENYNLTELNNYLMVLNFESDIQARGIAKLTFKKRKEEKPYAEKIQ